MTIHYSIRGLTQDVRMRRQMEADLEQLGRRVPVSVAEVTLESEARSMPPVQVVTVLVTQGRELRAAARDHTWQAAWQKVVSRLGEQIESQQTGDRQGGRAGRGRSDGRSGGRRQRRAASAA
jgi:hypothetical protein